MTIPHNLDDGGATVRRSSPAVLAKADLIAAEQHALRAADALARAIRQYAVDGSGEYALARVRARAALSKIHAAMPFIDGTDDQPPTVRPVRADIRAGIRARRQENGQ